MKKFILLLVMVFIGGRMWGQNLVPNGSFEDHYDCPILGGFNNDQVAECVGWWSFGNTSDYFHSCSNDPLVSTPFNVCGYQIPLTGSAYCGFLAFDPNDEHEFVGCRLNEPLIIGNQYHVELNVCSGNGGSAQPGVFSNNLGARFSIDSFSTNDPVAINNFAHINSSAVVSDTINWTKISGYFIADSAYEYIAFGNFFTNAMTDTIEFGQYVSRAYYFIDDVCVSTDSASCFLANSIQPVNKNTLSLSPNPVQNLLTINLSSPTVDATVAVYDVQGRKMNCVPIFIGIELQLNTEKLLPGIYLLQIINNKTGEREAGKFVKE